MHSTKYVYMFTLIMTVVAAFVLSGLFYATKDTAIANELIFNKRAVLLSVESFLPKPVAAMTDAEVQQVFDNSIEQKVLKADGSVAEGIKSETIDMKAEKKKPMDDRLYPTYTYKGEKEKLTIVAVRGAGLWDEIWANIALKSDMNTIAGAAFDHAAETPGLGAEIKDNPNFPAAFVGKTIYDTDGTFKSVSVVKGGVADALHQVDAISGATITGNGVTEMMQRGMKVYEPYLKNAKTAN